MATVAASDNVTQARRQGYRADQPFFTRFAIVLALVIVVGFAQFALRGFVDYRGAPLRAHFHGTVMLAWLGLFILQNRLAETGKLSAHRKLGRIGFMLAILVAGTAVYVGYAATLYGTKPPFFPPAYFLALTQLGALFFLGLVIWAVRLRRDTQWHRRLMFASLIAILEPAFGRLLPMPLLGPWGETVILGVQLVAFGILARHDRTTLGAVHPATVAGALVIVAYHVAVEIFGRFGPFVILAEGIGAA